MDTTLSISELFPTSSTPSAAENKNEELGQEDFMRLMVAQLENQDPTEPMDNFEFLSQIAQFNAVDGIQGLQQGFGDLASVLSSNQALDAAQLIGNKVVSGSNVGVLSEGETLDATIELPQSAADVVVYVQDMSGRVVYSESLGAAVAGELKLEWDGTDSAGNPMLPGQYRVSAEAVLEGQNQGVSVYAHSLVESVTVDPSGVGVALNLAGGEQMPLSAVKSFL